MSSLVMGGAKKILRRFRLIQNWIKTCKKRREIPTKKKVSFVIFENNFVIPFHVDEKIIIRQDKKLIKLTGVLSKSFDMEDWVGHGTTNSRHRIV